MIFWCHQEEVTVDRDEGAGGRGRGSEDGEGSDSSTSLPDDPTGEFGRGFNPCWGVERGHGPTDALRR